MQITTRTTNIYRQKEKLVKPIQITNNKTKIYRQQERTVSVSQSRLQPAQQISTDNKKEQLVYPIQITTSTTNIYRQQERTVSVSNADYNQHNKYLQTTRKNS